MVHRNEIIEIEITDFAFGGQGIARMHSEEGDFILFVELIKYYLLKYSMNYYRK